MCVCVCVVWCGLWCGVVCGGVVWCGVCVCVCEFVDGATSAQVAFPITFVFYSLSLCSGFHSLNAS